MKSYKIKHDYLFDLDLEEKLPEISETGKRTIKLKLSYLMSLKNVDYFNKLLCKLANNKIKIINDLDYNKGNITICEYLNLVVECYKRKFILKSIPVIE